MNKLIKYGSTEKIPYYNCSGKTDEEWYATGEKHTMFGWSVLIFGIFVEILYFPTIYLMFKTKLVRHSCYKIIVCLGFVDIVTTVVSCMISGVLFIKGAVYCNYPTLIYIAGGVGFGGWCCACACTLVLVINRVVDVLSRPFSDLLFEGNRTYIWIALILFYWFYVAVFCSTILFNSVIMAWVNNPLVIDNPSPEILAVYKNIVQLPNNFIFTIGVISLYTLYCVLVTKMEKGQKSKASKQVFLQSTIICFFNTLAAMGYSASILLPTPPWVVFVAEASWSGVHSAPAIIYLTMNKTIRTEFLKMFGFSNSKKITDSTPNKPTAGTGTQSDSRI